MSDLWREGVEGELPHKSTAGAPPGLLAFTEAAKVALRLWEDNHFKGLFFFSWLLSQSLTLSQPQFP